MIEAIIFAAAIGSGLMAGLFFVFSIVIMAALERIAPASGIAAMQSINTVILTPSFFLVFFGTALLCAALLIAAIGGWQVPARGYVIAASMAYLAGCIMVTIVWNVPLNDALAAVNPNSAEGATLWQRYLSDWTWWNHVRTLACIAATVGFTLAFGASA